MTLRHMKIFLSVCSHDYNTTKAAEASHISQPAVSLAIRELEEYYGVRLFDRIGKRLIITPVGRRFQEYAMRICGLFGDMERELRNWDHLGILRVGASITIGSQLLPGYVKEYQDCFPGTEVRVTIGPTAQIEKVILEDRLDFGLVEGIPDSPNFVVEPFMEDHLEVICPTESRFADGETISAEEFRQQKFLLREHGSGTREVFDRAVEKAGFSVCPSWEATSTAALIRAVISGLGIAVLPYRMVREPVERGLVRTLHVAGLDFSRKFYIIRHKDKFLTASAQHFLSLCRQSAGERAEKSSG